MDYISLGIVGALVSVFVQFVKNTAKTSGWKTLVILIAASLFGAGVYMYFNATPYWSEFLKILVIANAIYGLLIKRFEA